MPTSYGLLDDIPHKCPVQREAELPGVFRRMVAKHTYEDEEIAELAVALIIPVPSIGNVISQIDFCPFCGVELSTALRYGYVRPDMLRAKRAELREPYYEYRRRHVKTALASAPISQADWTERMAELEMLELLLAGGAGEHQDKIFERKQQIYCLLCLPDLRPDKGRIEIAREPLPDYDIAAEDDWYS